jgi:hypothetical protein
MVFEPTTLHASSQKLVVGLSLACYHWTNDINDRGGGGLIEKNMTSLHLFRDKLKFIDFEYIPDFKEMTLEYIVPGRTPSVLYHTFTSLSC